jgi:tetratricopeptide (TPR) repeat protein
MNNAWRSSGPGAALILLLTVVVYLPALGNGFIWDDEAYVTENQALRSVEGLRWIWTQPAVGRQQYYPITFTGLWIQYHLWGLKPFGYHLVNVLGHAANAILLWRALRQLETPGSWWAAAIFALHPVQVESVAWVTEFKNILSGFFALLSVLVFLRGHPLRSAAPPHPKRRLQIIAALLFLCALLSKTAVCSLPVAIGILIWWKLGRVGKRDLLALLPWLAAGLVLGLITVRLESRSPELEAKIFAPSIIRGALLGSRALWFYAGKLVWPANLCFIYPRWEPTARSVDAWLPLAGLLLVAAVLWYFRRASWARGAMSALGCFTVALLPVLAFFDIYFFRFSFVADHFQYLAGIALIAMAVGAVGTLARRVGRRGRGFAGLVAVAVLLACGARTWGRVHVYSSSETLWRDTLAQNPNAWLAHNNLGVILGETGRPEDAIRHYEDALRIRPGYAEAHYNLGVMLFRQGRVREAMDHWEQALRIDPGYARAHTYLGNALMQAEEFQQAAAEYEQALRIKPDYAEAHYNLGVALIRLGRAQEAAWHWEQALRINSDYAEAHNDLGAELARAGRLDEAIEHYQQALRTKPDFAAAHSNLGNAFMRTGRLGEAIEQYEQALRIDPDFVEAHYNLGVALEQSGRVQDAIEQYQQALRLKPDFAPARNALARPSRVQ